MNLIKNFLFLTGGEVLSKILTVVAIAYVARVVGPTGFGYIEFAISVSLLGGLLVHQGFGLYGAREIARDPDRTERLIAEITTIRFALAALAYVGLLLFVYLVDRPPVSEQLVLLYGLCLLLMPLGLQWVFQGHEKMHAVAALQLVRQAVFAAIVFALLRDADGIWAVAVAEIVAVAAFATVSIWFYRLYFGKLIPFPFAFSDSLIREGAVIGLGRLSWSARILGATAVVGLFASDEDVGYFAAAMRVLIALHVFIWLYFINLLPTLSRAWQTGPEELRRQVTTSMRLTCWLSLAAGVVWILLAPGAISVVYGNEFSPAALVLQVLGLVCVCAAIHGHFRFGLIAASRQRDEMVTSVLGTLVSLPLIPLSYWKFGLIGPALALVAGEIVIWVSAAWYSRQRLQLDSGLRFLVLPGICAVVILGAVPLLPSTLPIAAYTAIALLLFGMLAYASDHVVRDSIKHALVDLKARFASQRETLVTETEGDGDGLDTDRCVE